MRSGVRGLRNGGAARRARRESDQKRAVGDKQWRTKRTARARRPGCQRHELCRWPRNVGSRQNGSKSREGDRLQHIAGASGSRACGRDHALAAVRRSCPLLMVRRVSGPLLGAAAIPHQQPAHVAQVLGPSRDTARKQHRHCRKQRDELKSNGAHRSRSLHRRGCAGSGFSGAY